MENCLTLVALSYCQDIFREELKKTTKISRNIIAWRDMMLGPSICDAETHNTVTFDLAK